MALLYDQFNIMEINLIVDIILLNLGRCTDFRETAETIAKSGFRMFLNVVPAITNWSPSGDAFSLILDPNPLTDFVELPEDKQKLNYSNILCGVIRGALEMVLYYHVNYYLYLVTCHMSHTRI